jgi:uncharacterized Fe-S cluster-containing radical SAM superfamily enzyme
MSRLEFEDIKFEKSDKSDKCARLIFLRIFESSIDQESLERIGRFRIKDGAIDFPDTPEKQLQNKFQPLLANAFNNLRSTLTGHKAIYVHRNSGIPLIGTLYFGIVDRGTNILEVKPITGCNIDCIFCSVDEGKSSRKVVDFVVETDYLIDEVARVIRYKQADKEVKIDVFINTHGEPLLYASMARLVRGLREIKQVGTISIITNGTLLTKKLADELIEAGLDQLNMSLNAITPEEAKKLAGTDIYNIEQVTEIARYVAKKIRLVIAPVWLKGVNDAEITKIISFAKEIHAEVGVQNYMMHKLGRKAAKQVDWEEFYSQLDVWEKYSGAELRFKSHTAYKTRTLEPPFRKGDVVKAELMCPGRMKNEMLAVAKQRVISVIGGNKTKGTIKARIVKDKDNVFLAEEV